MGQENIAKNLLAGYTCETCMFCGSLATIEHFNEMGEQKFFDMSGIKYQEIRTNAVIEGTIFACRIRNIRALPEEFTCITWTQAEDI